MRALFDRNTGMGRWPLLPFCFAV